MLLRDHVIDLMGSNGVVLVNQAVFAAILRALDHLTTQLGGGSRSHVEVFWRKRALSIRPRCSRRSNSRSSPRSSVVREPSRFF